MDKKDPFGKTPPPFFGDENDGAMEIPVGRIDPLTGEEVLEEDTHPHPELTDSELMAMAQERICPTCPVSETAANERLRALAEVDNMRKRLQREQEEAVKFAGTKIISDIIPALDNLDLALDHARGNEACKDFFIGVEMTKKLLLEALAKHGLNVVGEVGVEFDPALHEAMGMTNQPDLPDNAVSALLNRGYTLHGRLLRPARVMVNKKS